MIMIYLIIFSFINNVNILVHSYGFAGDTANACDPIAAAACENNFKKCRIFTGPAGDQATLCKCGGEHYGDCLRLAGCETSNEVDPLSLGQSYMKLCVQHMMNNDCPDTSMCFINCASDGAITRANVKIIPFNNYGKYHLRIRICDRSTHMNKLDKYSIVESVPCKEMSDFTSCARFIPPMHFVPVALPSNTTYIEVDNCEEKADGTFFCHTYIETPKRIYGNDLMFPRTFDVPFVNTSYCANDDSCTGTFCDTHFRPQICSPKTLVHTVKSGAFYFSDPFG